MNGGMSDIRVTATGREGKGLRPFSAYRAACLLCGLLLLPTYCLAGCAAPAPPPPSPLPAVALPLPQPASPQPTPTPSPSPIPSPVPSPSPAPSPTLPTARPVRIRIEALAADAEIQATGREGNSMGVVDSAEIISWYKDSAIPGGTGNAILAGHNQWSGREGVIRALDTLEIGDSMDIEYEDGSVMSFVLESVTIYPLKTAPASEIMRLDGPDRVTVITCKGPFNRDWGTSENRIVAVFVRAEDAMTEDEPIPMAEPE